jgi:AP-2 complex subunit sigma-1
MIRWFLLQNRAGRTRLAKYYVPMNDAQKRMNEYDVFRTLSSREGKWSNIVEFQEFKLVYRRYAHLYFIMCLDVGDNELATLEAIHLFVEILDHFFTSVTELDIVLNFHKAYLILDEFVLAGELQESSKQVILERIGQLEGNELH